MSQRECAGFNWPVLSVPAENPLGVAPKTANWAWSARLVSDTPSCAPLSRALSLRARNCSGVPPASRAAGVAQLASDGNEVEPLSEVRCAHPRSAQIRRPDGVARSFQVSRNSVEPVEASRARNLLSKHD